MEYARYPRCGKTHAMNRRLIAILLGSLLLAAPGCKKKEAFVAGAPAPSAEMLSVTADRSPAGGLVGAASSSAPPAQGTQRYIAESHEVYIVTSEADLEKSWNSVVAFCGTIQCEIVSSKLINRASGETPSGAISLRVVPQDLSKILTEAQSVGKVTQHTTGREDKTTEVVDTEAKLKNLQTFRDNLRAMMSKPSATVRDLIEIQQQLTETQSEIDSETTQRKILANETEKIAVELNFNVEDSLSSRGAFAPIRTALRESGSVLLESTADAITLVFAATPWLLLIIAVIWILVRIWRRRKRMRAAATLASTPKT